MTKAEVLESIAAHRYDLISIACAVEGDPALAAAAEALGSHAIKGFVDRVRDAEKWLEHLYDLVKERVQDATPLV